MFMERMMLKMTPRTNQFMLEEDYPRCPICDSILMDAEGEVFCLKCGISNRKGDEDEN